MGGKLQIVLQMACMLNYEMIPNAGDNIIVCAPLMGPFDNVSSFKKLEFLLGKSSLS